jgi:hypothetical protein
MTLQASGSISLLDIQTEFGGSAPISLSEYYRGGSYVLASASSTIPSTSTISLSNYYGASAIVRPVVSSVAVTPSETATTFSIVTSVTLATTNTTGVTQTYTVNIYYNYAYYSTITLYVPNGSNYASNTLANTNKSPNYGPVNSYALYGICESVTSGTS